jgi:nucleotide-binding universal stress UspA family protein
MFKHILVPLDGSTLSEKALGIATTVARATSAQVTLLHSVTPATFVYTTPVPVSDDLYEQVMDSDVINTTNYLKKVETRLRDCGVENVEVKVLVGPAAAAIEMAAREGCDLVVMSTHGRTGVARTVWGSIADEVVRGVNIPVLLVSTRHQIPETDGCAPNFRRILVPLDGSELAEQALPIAGALAQVEGAQVLLLNVVPEPVADGAGPATDNRDAKADHYLNRAAICVLPSEVDFETLETGGEAGEAIVRVAKEQECDLIVMSTHGRGGCCTASSTTRPANAALPGQSAFARSAKPMRGGGSAALGSSDSGSRESEESDEQRAARAA